MTVSQEQFNIAFGVIIALIVALTGYLNKQSSAKRDAQTHDQLAQMQTKVDDVHAAVTQTPPPMGINIQPSPFTGTQTAGLVDGHELPFVKPPGVPLP